MLCDFHKHEKVMLWTTCTLRGDITAALAHKETLLADLANLTNNKHRGYFPLNDILTFIYNHLYQLIVVR